MLMAPRTVTSRLGNSAIATLLAEYTEAPASFTITFVGFCESVFNTSVTKVSVSRPAVPLPMAISSIWWVWIRCFSA